MQIQTVTDGNFDTVLPLIAAYQRFYKAEPDEARNRAHFGQFLDKHERGILFLGTAGGAPVGFATLYFNYSSISAAGQCIMNDLYVVPELRGKGLGRQLIEHCRAYAKAQGYPALAWFTAEDNKIAQALYERMEGSSKALWWRYSVGTK